MAFLKSESKIYSIWGKRLSNFSLVPKVLTKIKQTNTQRPKYLQLFALLLHYDFHKNGNNVTIKEFVCWSPFNKYTFASETAQFTLKKPVAKGKYETLLNIHTHICIIGGFLPLL